MPVGRPPESSPRNRWVYADDHAYVPLRRCGDGLRDPRSASHHRDRGCSKGPQHDNNEANVAQRRLVLHLNNVNMSQEKMTGAEIREKLTQATGLYVIANKVPASTLLPWLRRPEVRK